MASEVPHIDLGSLSMQQLQHLLATSRHAGRKRMADAVAHELRDRRSRPEAARSWMNVEFGDLPPEPEDAFPHLEPQAAPSEPQAVPPSPAASSEHLAAPYHFTALRAVPYEGPPAGAAGTLTLSTASGGVRRRRGAGNVRPRRVRAGVVAAVGGGAMALAFAAAVGTLAPSRAAPPPVEEAALHDPAPTTGQSLPRASAALLLPLRGPIAQTPDTAQQPAGEFSISAADLQVAAEHANQADMAKAHAEGLQGTWLNPNWAPARCRWSPTDPSLAICRTRSRYGASGPWRESVGRYRRDADGDWQAAP